jgi:hypothetical protein
VPARQLDAHCLALYLVFIVCTISVTCGLLAFTKD